MSRAIDDLRHEHDAIQFALKILANMTGKLEAGRPVAKDDLTAFIGFLKEFADTCHHGKEEGLLFPALAEAGQAAAGAPVAALLEDHVAGRRWIAEMAAALDPTLDPTAFARAAQGYTHLLHAHITTENEVLFPLAESVLSPERLQSLFEGFEDHEARVMGPGRHEALHSLLKSLKDKYSGA